ncbi:MAG: sigma-54 dependent transcriptional regulator [Pseudomonadota bacterium]
MTDLLRFKLLGSSTRFQAALTQIQKIARVDATVLIEGETGTGKELAARAIHYLGARRDHPFIPVNCGALAESLLESELFGHERGAFTDAKAATPGLVSQADGGTLFLDEVDALSLKAQAAMLRFLQDRSYRRVGGGQTRLADVRVVVATNASLEKQVASHHFRRDLLYRLNVLTLRMPALRERGEDAVELAGSFLARFSQQYRLPPKLLHPDFTAFIEQYDWPGNVRELENVMHRAFLMCEGKQLHLDALDQHGLASAEQAASFKDAKARAIAQFERRYVHGLMQLSQGNITQAARMAGQDRSAFGKLVRKHGLGTLTVAE